MASLSPRADLLPGDVIPLNPAKPLNRRQRAKAATRARLLDAARFLFTNMGFFNTGMRDIALRMGMSTGAVFANVSDKDQLWRDAMGGPAPSLGLAEEVALLQAQRPDWRIVLTIGRDGANAVLQPPGFKPFDPDGPHLIGGQGSSPAAALRQAREACDRADGRFGDQPAPQMAANT